MQFHLGTLCTLLNTFYFFLILWPVSLHCIYDISIGAVCVHLCNIPANKTCFFWLKCPWTTKLLSKFAVVLLSVYLLVIEQIMLSRITGTQRCVVSMKEMGTIRRRKLWTDSVHVAVIYRCWSQTWDRLQLTHISQRNWLNLFHHQPLYVLICAKNWVIVYYLLSGPG